MKKDKIVYKYEGYVNVEEYKKMAKYFPNRMYYQYVALLLFYNLIICSILSIISRNFWSSISLFLVFQAIGMIYLKIRLEHVASLIYLKRNNGNGENRELKVEFYNDYLISIWPNLSIKINYKDIERLVENDTNVYLENGKNNVVIMLLKEKCNKDIIEFLKRKVERSEKIISNPTKLENTSIVSRGLFLLFIFTILSLFVADSIHDALNSSINPILAQYKDKWIYLLFMTIPISSIILGIKYKDKGYKCKKNIVGGAIITFFLITHVFICCSPFIKDYSKINDYKDILNIELPKEGMLEVLDIGKYNPYTSSEDQRIYVYYDKNTNLENSLKNSKTWELSTKISPELKDLIPKTMTQEKSSYISIYNGTTNEYNKLPTEKGVYKIYVMKYYLDDKTLEIHQYDYNYNNV